MLDSIIPYLDSQLDELNYFNELPGLAVRITQDGKSYPVFYDTKGNYRQINFEGQVGYHRETGPTDIDVLEGSDEQPTGNASLLQLIYPMRFVFFLKVDTRGNDSQYTRELVANRIAYTIYDNFYTGLNSTLSADYVRFDISQIDTDRKRVFDMEFGGIPFKVDTHIILGAVDYQITVEAREECLLAANTEL